MQTGKEMYVNSEMPVESAIIVATSEELEKKDFPLDPDFGRTKLPVQIVDQPGTSIQRVLQNADTIPTENVALYKTILALIALSISPA